MRKFYYLTLILILSCQDKKNLQINNVNEALIQGISIIEPTESTKGEIENLDIGCGFNHKLKGTSINLSLPKNRELEQINSILNHVGIPMNFEFYRANIDNAGAIIIDNKRYIIYDERLFNYSDKIGGTYWNSMSILAHEIGHHLSGHTLSSNSSLEDELEADKFSGFVLFKMGAKLSEATNAISLLGTEKDNESHPSKYRRIEAIRNGWQDANSQRYNSATPPPPIDDNENFQINKFSENDILDADMINYVNNHDNLYNNYEGIIINVDNEDPSGNYIDPYHNMLVTIELTKINKEQFDENRKIGNRYKFNLINYYQSDNITLSWLKALMVPGRKIRFNSFYIGWDSESFTSIEKLNR